MTTLPVQQLYIHGQRVDATSGKTFKTVNPATGEVIAEVQVASQADVERAVQRSRRPEGVGRDDRHGALAHPAPRRRAPARAQRRTGPPGNPGHRQGAGRDHHRGHRHRCRRGRVLRRPGHRHRRHPAAAARIELLLHPSRAAGRGRRHRRMELPDPDRHGNWPTWKPWTPARRWPRPPPWTSSPVPTALAGRPPPSKASSCRCANRASSTPSRAAGRGRRHRRMELPDPDRHEVGAGAGCRQRDGVRRRK